MTVERINSTEKEFFDAGLVCGEFPRYTSLELRVKRTMAPECGASDWRVLSNAFLGPVARLLECQVCGLWTPVECPDWDPKEAVARLMAGVKERRDDRDCDVADR